MSDTPSWPASVKVVVLTQAQYTALASPSATTLYVIVG